MGYCLISIPVLLRKHRHVSVQAQGPLADGHPRPKDSIASRTEGMSIHFKFPPPLCLHTTLETISRTDVTSSLLAMPVGG